MTTLQKTSLASLVVGLVLALFLVPPVLKSLKQTTDTMVAQQTAQAAVSTAPAPSPDQIAANLESQKAQTRLIQAHADLTQAQAQFVREKAVQAATPPKPASAPAPYVEPAHSYTPKGAKQSGHMYTVGDVKRDNSAPHAIVDFSPANASRIQWQEAVRSKRCAVFSFHPEPGKTVNRLWCDGAVARR